MLAWPPHLTGGHEAGTGNRGERREGRDRPRLTSQAWHKVSLWKGRLNDGQRVVSGWQLGSVARRGQDSRSEAKGREMVRT